MGSKTIIEQITSDRSTEIADHIGVAGISALMVDLTGFVDDVEDQEMKQFFRCVSYFAGAEAIRQIRRLDNSN